MQRHSSECQLIDYLDIIKKQTVFRWCLAFEIFNYFGLFKVCYFSLYVYNTNDSFVTVMNVIIWLSEFNKASIFFNSLYATRKLWMHLSNFWKLVLQYLLLETLTIENFVAPQILQFEDIFRTIFGNPGAQSEILLIYVHNFAHSIVTKKNTISISCKTKLFINFSPEMNLKSYVDLRAPPSFVLNK